MRSLRAGALAAPGRSRGGVAGSRRSIARRARGSSCGRRARVLLRGAPSAEEAASVLLRASRRPRGARGRGRWLPRRERHAARDRADDLPSETAGGAARGPGAGARGRSRAARGGARLVSIDPRVGGGRHRRGGGGPGGVAARGRRGGGARVCDGCFDGARRRPRTGERVALFLAWAEVEEQVISDASAAAELYEKVIAIDPAT
jgi:hypothetical protein